MSFDLPRRGFLAGATVLPVLGIDGLLGGDAAAAPRPRMEAAKLNAIPRALQPFIDRGELPGIVTLTWHRGSIVQALALGSRDMEARAPMRRDSLFQIASMTKPITSAAVLMLADEGKLQLDDPIQKWIPELADRRVLRDPGGPLQDTVEALRPISVEDLLTHRSGLAYGMFSTGPVAEAYAATLGDALHTPLTPDAWLQGLSTLPLLYQPGTRMNYSVSTDVLGFMISRIEGKGLREVLKERIFAPLRMTDTDFYVPPEKRNRAAFVYSFDRQRDRLVKDPSRPLPRKLPVFTSGGGGLISTADDYLTFARMLLNEGEVDGVRLLKAKTVRDMRTNRLTAAQRQDPFVGRPVWAGMGFGLGLGIVDAPEKSLLGSGSPGSFSWPGAFGTWWQADPVENLITVYMIQHSLPLTPDAGVLIAGGRGVAGREALPIFERMTYDALAA